MNIKEILKKYKCRVYAGFLTINLALTSLVGCAPSDSKGDGYSTEDNLLMEYVDLFLQNLNDGVKDACGLFFENLNDDFNYIIDTFKQNMSSRQKSEFLKGDKVPLNYCEYQLKLVMNDDISEKLNKFDNSIYEYVKLINDKEILKQFIVLANNSNLSSSDYYEYTLQLASKADSAKRIKIFNNYVSEFLKIKYYNEIANLFFEVNLNELDQFVQLVLNSNLLNSRYYLYTLKQASKLNKDLYYFSEVCNPDILQLEQYEDIVCLIVENISDGKSISTFLSSVTNKHIYNFKDYDYALVKLSKMNVEEMNYFVSLAPEFTSAKKVVSFMILEQNINVVNNESSDFKKLKEIINQLDESCIEDFIKIATNRELLSSKYYSKVIDEIKYLSNPQQMYVYACLATNNDLIESGYFDNVLDKLKYFYGDFKVIDNSYFEVLINTITNKKLLSEISDSYIFDDIFSELLTFIFEGKKNEFIQLCNLVNHKNLLNSEYYDFQNEISGIYFADTTYKLNKFIDLEILSNVDLSKSNPEDVMNLASKCYGINLDLEYYEYMLNLANKITEEDKLIWFIDMGFNVVDLKTKNDILDVIAIPTDTKKFSIINSFLKTSSGVRYNPYYGNIVSLVSSINDYTYYMCYCHLIDNIHTTSNSVEIDFKESNYYHLILNRVIKLGEDYRIPELISQFIANVSNYAGSISSDYKVSEDIYKQLFDVVMSVDNYENLEKELDKLYQDIKKTIYEEIEKMNETKGKSMIFKKREIF